MQQCITRQPTHKDAADVPRVCDGTARGDPATGRYNPTRSIYVDHLVPWITYRFDPVTHSLIVGNVVTQMLDALLGLSIGKVFDELQLQTGVDMRGVQVVENFDFYGSYLGARQFELAGQGTLGMVFKAPNPLLSILAMAAPLLGLVGVAMQTLMLADAALSVVAAIQRAAKAADWVDGTDPLIIDLDGDGIETIALQESKAWFDTNGDLFAERTGWVKGDDGFLVLDANANGRIDDVSEMFGNRFEGGYAELGGLDGNGDGRITLADATWSELKVWRDADRDGESDAGELVSLDALGINAMIALLQPVMEQCIVVSRRFAVRLATNDNVPRWLGEAA